MCFWKVGNFKEEYIKTMDLRDVLFDVHLVETVCDVPDNRSELFVVFSTQCQGATPRWFEHWRSSFQLVLLKQQTDIQRE
jgi:hypothetical protein